MMIFLVGGEKPTQFGKLCRVVGFLKGMRGGKQGERMRKTYAGRENW